ncbi:MAG TPA: DUF4382 domain-containing protein [Terracidiphilus sp.]|nr:DUF4382 domain-containing protein [Terracidiphilus sp.]
MTHSPSRLRSSRLWQSILVLGCLILLTGVTGIIVACSSGSAATASGMAQVHVTLSDPATCAAPDGPYSAVWVTVSDVQANISSTAGATDSGWTDLTPNLTKNNQAIQVNLLGEANNQCFLASLGDNLELQAGSYQQIRLILAPTTAGLTLSTGSATDPAISATDMCQSAGSANCVVANGTTYPLQLSSEAQTGIKIPSGQIAGGAFNISAGQTEDLNIDFNTCSSIVQEGNGKFRLKPVLHAGEVGTTSVSMNGKVVDANGNPIAGAIVALEQPMGTDANGNPVDRFLVAATTASDGTWVICPVMQGDPTKPYDVVVTGSDSTGIALAPTIVTGVSVGSTVGTVTLNASASVLAATGTPTNSLATLSGQVTSVNASSAGTVIDADLTVLETIGSMDYTIPIPMTTTQTGGADLIVTTAPNTNQNPACNPTSADCANYALQLPASGAYIGAWSSSTITYTPPANPLATYFVDGNATVSGSSSSIDCTPSEQMTAATALTSTPLPSTATGLDLAFTGCQ